MCIRDSSEGHLYKNRKAVPGWISCSRMGAFYTNFSMMAEEFLRFLQNSVCLSYWSFCCYGRCPAYLYTGKAARPSTHAVPYAYRVILTTTHGFAAIDSSQQNADSLWCSSSMYCRYPYCCSTGHHLFYSSKIRGGWPRPNF